MSAVDSVNQWLLDLRDETECECMSVLQGKSLSKESYDFLFVVPKSTKDHILTLHQTFVRFKTEIKKLSRLIEIDKWNSARETSTKIIRQIESQISNCKSSLHVIPSHMTQLQASLLQECTFLAKHMNFDAGSETSVMDPMITLISSLERDLHTLTDDTLCVLVKNILDNCSQLFHFLEENSASTNGSVTSGARSASNLASVNLSIRESDHRLLVDSLSDIIVIGLQSNYMCSVLAKMGAVNVLVEMCSSSAVKFARCEALRTLATICCVSESIEQLVQNGGIACLINILTDGSVAEAVRSEAAGVIAQVTSPSLANCQLQMGLLENIPELVRSLTGLCRETRKPEIFLMSCAALANLTSVESLCCDYFNESKTLAVLVESCLQDKTPSIFAKEQVVTVIESAVTHQNCDKDSTSDLELAKLLVSFLSERHRSEATAMELLAYENVLQKTALTIDQLCHVLPNAILFVKLQCIHHLVCLCQDPVARNHSDAVLAACLGAIRRIFSVCGPNHELLMDEREASKLISSRLVDSYVLCKSAKESFI